MDDVSRIHIPETMIAFAENLDKVEIYDDNDDDDNDNDD